MSDTSTVQAAISTAGEGGEVTLPPGNYTVEQITSAYANQVWNLYGVTFTLATGANETVVVLTHNKITINGLTINGAKGMQTGSGNTINGILVSSNYCTLRDMEVSNAIWDGIRVTGNYCAIENAHAYDNDEMGVRFFGSDNSSIHNSRANTNGRSGIDVDAICTGILISNCWGVGNDGNGIFIEEASQRISVVNAIVTDNGLHGLNINQQVGSQTLKNIVCSNITATANGTHGIRIAANTSTTIVENVVLTGINSYGNGQVDSTGTDLRLSATSGAAIRNVHVIGGRLGEAHMVSGSVTNYSLTYITGAP